MIVIRRTGRMALAALMTVSLALVWAPDAGARTSPTAATRDLPGGQFRLENLESGDCLTIDDNGDLYMNWCDNADDHQLWDSGGEGTALRNVVTGHCVEDLQRGNVHGEVCDGTAAQRWQHTDKLWLQNWQTASCLADNGGAYSTTCDNYLAEQWNVLS